MALKVIPEKEWSTMLHQSLEIGWCYINPEIQKSEPQQAKFMDGMVDLGTGALYAEQLILMLENLPVDITFVDENDEVRYFSGAKHRIFPRSKAIIGRKVQNCHPPESVHVVNREYVNLIVNLFSNIRHDMFISILTRFSEMASLQAKENKLDLVKKVKGEGIS